MVLKVCVCGILYILFTMHWQFFSKSFLSLLLECGDQKILSINMSPPVCHGKITGKMVQVTFDSRHDIQTAVNKVYAGGDESQMLEATKVYWPFMNIDRSTLLIA